MIAITQPRRVAATSLAQRVSAERGVPVGTIVGYAVRFDEKFCPQTRIKYMTDGMIIRELFSDRNLSQYSVVIVDEAHERTLRTDMLLSILKTVQQKRNVDDNTSTRRRLKIVIMSATLDVEKFRSFYSGLVSYCPLRVNLAGLIWSQGQCSVYQGPTTSSCNISHRRQPDRLLGCCPTDIFPDPHCTASWGCSDLLARYLPMPIRHSVSHPQCRSG
jgi:hypothetical protein